MTDTSLVANIILRLQDEASRGLDNARQHVSGIGQEIDRVKQLAIGLFSFVAIKSGIENLIGLSDTFASLNGRIKQAVGAAGDYVAKQKQLFDIAQRTAVSLEDTTALYARGASALKNFSNGQELAAKLTETVNLSFKAQSSSAAEVSSTVTQLTQSIATDAVQWEDFGQLADTNLMLVNIAAKNLGYDGIGSLKKAMSEGKVSNVDLVNAIVDGFKEVKDAADQMPLGVAKSWQQLKTQFLEYVGLSGDATDATHGMVGAIQFVTKHLNELIPLVVSAGEVLLAAFGASKLKALITYTEGMLAAKKAAAEFVGPVQAATGAVTLFSRAIGLISKSVYALIAWEVVKSVAEWAMQFKVVANEVDYLKISIDALKQEFVAFGAFMTRPLSFESWRLFREEIQAIESHAVELQGKIGNIDTVPVPTVFDKLKASANEMAEGIDAALTKASGAATAHATEMVKPYDDAAKAIVTAFESQSAQIDANLKERLYAIDYLATSEKQKIAETTQAVIDAEFEKTTAALNTKIQLDQTWNETYGKAIELARQAGGDISTLEQQGAEARIGSLQTVVNAYQSSVDNMIGEEHRLLDAVRHTAEERENLSRSVEDKVRALQQKGMSDVQAYADQQKQIDEKQAAAKKAIQEGNFTDAKKFAEEAIRLAESTAHAVDNVSKDAQGKTQRKEAISENQAIAKSIQQIKESAALADTALSGLGNSQAAQAKSVAASLQGAKSGLAEFKGELERTVADVNSKAQLKISIDAESAKAEIDKLAALTAAKELAVKIKADPINADQEIADLQAKLTEAKITVPAVVAFDKIHDEELAKIQEELRKSIAFLTAVPVGIDTTDAVATLESMKADIDAKLSAPTEAVHHVNPDFLDVLNKINEIKQNTYSTHTVYVNEVRQHATGGLIQHLATGGRVAAQTFRRVVGAITGPGTGTSDDVAVMASNGEYVVKTDAVQHYGVNFMNALNNKQLPVAPGYAIGGAIGEASPVGATGWSPEPQRDVVDLNFNFGQKTITLQGSKSVARDLAIELRSLARVS